MTPRRTLRDSTETISGIGLHTGAPSWVRVSPSGVQSETGQIRFRAADGAEQVLTTECVVDSLRCTTVDICGRRLSTIEHLMSAIAGVGITDAVVEFDGPEVPILDGSAIGFVREFRRVGVCDLGAETDPIVLTDAIDLIGPSEERLIAVPAEHFSVTVVIEYRDRPSIGIQAASFAPGIDFDREVAEARTYGFLSELEAVKRMGLALGASLENCIALLDDGSPDPRTPLRYGNELARHKLLDVIGDLALVGKPIHAQVVALRPSHAVNSGLARRLAHQ